MRPALMGDRADRRYTRVAIALHWLIAFMIFAMLALGFVMTSGRPSSFVQFRLFQLHKSLGITILALSLLRLVWRLLHRPPLLPPGMTRGERTVAHLSHAAFYVLMIGMPMTGWALVSTSSMHLPTVLYGLVTLPPLPVAELGGDVKTLHHLFGKAHGYGAWIMIALVVLHVGAALMHHFIRRDTMLHRMLPIVPLPFDRSVP